MIEPLAKNPKDAPLGLRVPSEVKHALERAAINDDRSVASLVLKIVTEWLRERKYLKKKTDRIET